MGSREVYILAPIFYILIVGMTEGQLYNNTMAILRDKLGKNDYDTQVRPLKDQSKVMIVSIQFFVMSLVEVNDVTQSFVCNGFLPMNWTDEMVAWDPKDYGNETMIHPLLQDIWRPKIVLMNTIGVRDLFGDDDVPLYIFYNGKIQYVPGALFPTSCELDLVKFPFDIQNCVIELAAMSQIVDEMQFEILSTPEVNLELFTPHVEWDLVGTSVEIKNATNALVTYSAIRIHFVLQRHPAFLLLNIILPVVFLSFLNIFVFIIPAQSGEKVGFGITVLLALSVFLSTVSTMLPRSSKSLPRVTIYLFILLVISLLTVLDSILIVYLHFLEEREMQLIKAKNNYRNGVKKVNAMQKVIRTFPRNVVNVAEFSKDQLSSQEVIEMSDDIGFREDDKKTSDGQGAINRYRVFGKYIDLVSFIVFLVTWVLVTIGFMLDITSVTHV